MSLLVIFTALDRFLTDTMGFYIGLGLHAVVIGHVVVSLPFTVLTIVPLPRGARASSSRKRRGTSGRARGRRSAA